MWVACIRTSSYFPRRYFAPREVARLHGFPDAMAFPPSVGKKKQYELLGNSLSVPVVTSLLKHLLLGE